MKNIFSKILSIFKFKKGNKKIINEEIKVNENNKINSTLFLNLTERTFDILVKERKNQNFDLEKNLSVIKSNFKNLIKESNLTEEEENKLETLLINNFKSHGEKFWNEKYYFDLMDMNYLKYPVNSIYEDCEVDKNKKNVFMDLKNNHKKIITIIKNIKDEKVKQSFFNVWSEGIKVFKDSKNLSNISFFEHEKEIGLLLENQYYEKIMNSKLKIPHFVFYSQNYIKINDYLKNLKLSNLKFSVQEEFNYKLIYLNRFNINYLVKLDLLIFNKEVETIISKTILDFDKVLNS